MKSKPFITMTPNGILVSDIINGQHVKCFYVGYTIKAATKAFKQSLITNKLTTE